MSQETEMNLSKLGLDLKSRLDWIALETEKVKTLKKEIRAIMIDNDLKEFENPDDNLYMKCQRSFSFDIGAFKLDQPGFSASFITQETITKVKDVLDKKRLKNRYPKEYAKYLCENTARLTVK